MAVRGPRGRLRHRRGRGALTSRGVAPPDLRAAPHRQTSVRHTTARPPCGTPPPDLRAAPHRQTSVRREACPPARRPRRELRSARRLEARPGPAGLAPPSSRAATTTRLLPPGPATTHRRRSHHQPTSLAPPSSRAATTTWPCRHLPAPQPPPAPGLAPPSSRAATTTWPCRRPPAPRPPPAHRAHAHPIG